MTDNHIQIRRATETDLQGIDLLQAANQQNVGGTLSAYMSRDWILEAIRTMPVIVAQQDNTLVGFLFISTPGMNLGIPIVKAMLDAFPDGCDILTVWQGDTPLASVLSFYHDGAVLPFWGGGRYAARPARANELMYYELMLHARRQGMTRFDFGRSKTGSGPFAFKKNWGFDPVPLTYGAWIDGDAPKRNIDPTDASYSRKIELWKKLPLPVANTLGPWIARGLA